MKVLMITGDRSFGPGHPRFELQKAVVDSLDVVYWGRGALWPNVPQGHYDVVTSQDPFLRGLFAWGAAKNIGAKLNVQVHADLSGQSFPKRVLAWLVLHLANSVRVVSPKLKTQVEAFGTRAPITVLPVFVDLATFRSIKPKEHPQKTILWLGRFEPEKDPLFAIAMFKEVHDTLNDAKLILLGRGSLEEEMREAVRIFNLGANVEFPGWRIPMHYLEVADVVLCTSVHESWGASIVESLAAGVPVVAPDVGVAREAGAFVVQRIELAKKVLEVLSTGAKGELRLPSLISDPATWATTWRESL